jgi:hypothetical protein
MLTQAWEEVEPLISPYYDEAIVVIVSIVVIILGVLFLPKAISFLLYHRYIVTKDDWLLVRSVRTHIRNGAYLILEFDDGDRALFQEPENCLCIEGDLLPVKCKMNTKNGKVSYFYGRHFIVKRNEEIEYEKPKVIDFKDRVRGLVSNGN